MLIVGIAGGTGSGKTTVVNKIMACFLRGEVALLPQDSYYKDNSHLPLEERQRLNFDHPDSIEWSLLIEHLKELRQGRLVLTQKEVRDLLDIKVFVDADADDRLARVIRRDIQERGRSAEIVLNRYEKTVKPMHLDFIEPSKRYADLIIPQGGDNKVGIRVLSSLIREHLLE
jgi:uridine kinase